MMKLLVGLIEIPLNGDTNKKVTHTEVIEKMGMLIYTIQPFQTIRDTLPVYTWEWWWQRPVQSPWW